MPGNAVDLIPINVVALRKESVDRNLLSSMRRTTAPASLSARRAWIEMIMLKRQLKKLFVALRKESVDRNTSTLIRKMQLHQSLSARRAWIEMAAACRPARGVAVALRKESVDRNL